MDLENQNLNPPANQDLSGPPPAKEGEGQPPVVEPKVELTGEQYNAILDHIAALESKLLATPQGRGEVKRLDDLIDEAQERPQPPAPPVGQKLNFEDMAPEQVINHLMGAIHQNLIKPLEVKVETLRIINEIDKVASKQGNEDFWDYADEVKNLAIKNPTLTIAQAYQLAKSDGKRKPAGPGEPGLIKKSDKLFSLPPRPNIAGGEKPGASGAQVRSTTPISRRDAASEAFDNAMKRRGT